MEILRALVRGWLGTSQSQVGYRQPVANHESLSHRDPETLSASVNLEDIIDEYDEPSQRSRNNISTSRNRIDEQPSQSFFSVSGTRDDETTSFYSALYDGFSLDQFEFNRNKSGREFLWRKNSCDNSVESDIMLPQSDFQITWTDLTYTLRPRSTYADVWDDFKETLTASISSALGFVGQLRAASYNVSGPSKDLEGNVARETITILRNVNGSFKSGQLTAIMGPSGAGKTSLLNILSRRHETGFTGRLCVNQTNHTIKINSIPQDDHLLGSLTTRENLLYASKLKNPHSKQDHEKGVCSVSNLLGLNDCLDTRTKNLSGGQQKRLAIAQELLSKPDILILDEPTSGLDSLTCLKTLSVLKDLVRPSNKPELTDPIAIVLTIHQPQQEAFKMFDKVYVMATGGTVIYDGSPDDCVKFVEKYSGLTMPSHDYNPATFLIEIASGEFGQGPIDSLARQVRIDSLILEGDKQSIRNLAASETNALGKVSKKHSASTRMETDATVTINSHDDMDEISSASESKHKSQLYLDRRLVKRSSVYSGAFFYKTLILTLRCWKTTWREPMQMIARIFFHLFLPFGLAAILGTGPGSSNACPTYRSEYSIKKMMTSDEYLNSNTQEEFFKALENIGILFCTMYACISASIAANTLIFALDMRTCLKEYYNGWYSMNSYVFARIISNLPLDLVLPVVTTAITYVITGQNTGENDSYYVHRIMLNGFAIVLGSLAGEMMGMIFGTIYVRHITTALFASQGATLPFVLLSGFVARTKNMSKFVQLLSYTSLYKHCLEATFIARYGWNVCGCQTDDNFKQVALTGVPEDLRKFVKNFMDGQVENDETTEAISTTTSAAINASNTLITPGQDDANDDDLFQMVAKQLSLYNTYGIEVKSCDQVIPYEMHDFAISEKQLPMAFLALITLLSVLLITLLMVVRLVLTYRTSL